MDFNTGLNYLDLFIYKCAETIIAASKNCNVYMLRCFVVVDGYSLIQLYPFPVAKEHLCTVDTVGSPWSVFNKHSN